MKTKHLLLTLQLALMVPLAALAQVERTATVYNGWDKECHVPVYGNVTRMDDLSYSQFIMDKSVLQAAGLAGKEITKMTLHLANSVPASYEWTTKRRTVVTLAEVDASELDGSFIQDMTNSTNVFADYLDAHGETMEISFGTPFTYSGEKNLLVQFREEYMYYFNYHPFASYRLPMYYGVYKTGASYWRQVRASNNYSTISSLNCHFVPKTSFTYLTEANWANTKAPKNARITASNYSTGNNNNINYYIRMDWDASDNYTGSYQVLCVPRGTTPLDWSTAATTSDTFYLFEGLQKNTAYDLYVRAKSGLFFTSNAAMASASTPFYPANLDEGPLTFDFNSQTMPNGLDFNCSIPRYLSAYGRLGYSNLGTNYVGATVYNDTPPVTITLPELKFTNANNGLMLEFDLQGVGWEVHNFHTAELQVKIYDYGYDEEVFSDTVSASYPSQHFTFRLPDLTTSNYHIYKLSFSYAGGPGFGLDNIVVRKAPNIMPPYNLAASEITPTSAEISWMDDNTNNHTFDLVYRQKGYSNDPNVWEHYVEGVTNPYTLTGLTPYTDYEVKVKTITSSAYEDSEILEFSTLCTPAEVPYNESFTGLTTLPTNWRVNVPEYAEVVTEVGNGRLTLHNTATEVTQNIYGYISTYTSYSEFGAYIILPYFNNLGSLQLSFKAGRTQGTMESLSVGVVADPNNYTDYTEIGTATLTDNANGEVYSYNLVNDAVQSGHIVIYFGKYESNLQSIWLDDFYVQQYAAPTGPVVSNVTNTTATLGWNAGAATQWEVRYKATTDSSWESAIAVTEPACTITGLTASTDYVAQVRAKYGDNLYSDWVSFEGFKTYYSAPILVDASHPYSHGFSAWQSSGMGMTMVGDIGGWQLINKGLFGNDWALGTAPGRLNGSLTGLNNYSLYISKDGSTYQYIHGETPLIGGGWQGWGTTVYAARVFTLTPGSYQFSYRWYGKGIHASDYFRVALVPANTELTASNSGPTGFSYNSLPTGWIALDGGEALNPMENNVIGFASYTTPESSRINILEEGNYMMVFVWQNDGMKLPSAVNPPVAIDEIGISCVSLITPPDMSTLVAAPTDTQATLTWSVPICTLTPTSYEVEYATEASFTDALTATTNTNSVTLTGLAANTNYYVRIRSAYTANGTTIYSDWSDARVFSTQYPIPTNLAIVRQTTSMAQVMWTPVEMTLPEEQAINYSYQLTTDVNDWGETNEGLASNGWERNLAPGIYHLRVRTAIYDSNIPGFAGFSDWSEPITFTIAPWTDPVTIFPLTYDFEEWSNHFADGLTLDGDYDYLDILTYGVSDVPTPEEGDNEYALQFRSTANKTACLVLPPLRPSTSSALVSFWWYHNSSDNYAGEGVIVEYSSDGSSWTSFGDVIPRYAAETGWVKYQKVVPTVGPDADYIRLRFIGSNSNQWSRYCYLDDLKVYAFKSEQPYISYVGCDSNSATITLYDYAVENGYHSSAFQVQYREWRDPSETQETWVDYDVFVNQEPYTFENTLTVNGLQPATCYEFRARARVSYGGYDFDWSGYCEPVRQWTDCGTYTITPSYSYTEDFEEEFYLNCWTADEGWEMQHEGGHSGNYCAYLPANTNSKMTMPLISSSGCNNVIIRFWSKGPGKIYAYYGQDFGTKRLVGFMSNTTDWVQYELSISYLIKNNAPLKITFEPDLPYRKAWCVDDIEIVANAYGKIFDPTGASYIGAYEASSLWFPNGVPTAEDNVMIMGSAKVGFSETTVVNTAVGNVAFSHHGSLSVNKSATLTANRIDATKQVTVYGTANVTTFNAAKANSVVVKDGGVLNATIINGTTSGGNDKIRIESGGQVKSGNDFYGIIEKNITGYGAANADTPTGWNLIATPALVTAVQTFVPKTGSEYQFDQMDIYRFIGGNDLEWDNYKCPFEGGCDSPFGTIPQGQFSAELGQPLKGYLYALQEDATIQFAAGLVSNVPFSATNVDADVNLTCYNNPDDASLNGWNLIGNPYTCNAYLKQGGNYIPFYKMNDTGDAIVGVPAGTPIKPCEAVFVCCTVPGSTVTFTTTEPAGLGNSPEDPTIQLPTHVLYEDQDATMTTTVTQTLNLSAGVNWVSFYVETTLDDLKTALVSALSNASGIKITSQNNGYAIWNGSSWRGSLNSIDVIQMYVVEVPSACEISLEAMPIDPSEHPITIVNGTNWIGFPFSADMSLTDAFNGFAVNGDKVSSQNNGNATYQGSWNGGLSTLQPGQGYKFESTTTVPRTFTYPSGAKKAKPFDPMGK